MTSIITHADVKYLGLHGSTASTCRTENFPQKPNAEVWMEAAGSWRKQEAADSPKPASGPLRLARTESGMAVTHVTRLRPLLKIMLINQRPGVRHGCSRLSWFIIRRGSTAAL